MLVTYAQFDTIVHYVLTPNITRRYTRQQRRQHVRVSASTNDSLGFEGIDQSRVRKESLRTPEAETRRRGLISCRHDVTSHYNYVHDSSGAEPGQVDPGHGHWSPHLISLIYQFFVIFINKFFTREDTSVSSRVGNGDLLNDLRNLCN